MVLYGFKNHLQPYLDKINPKIVLLITHKQYNMENPYEILLNEVKEVKSLLINLKNRPDKELINKFYTRNEASKILKVSPQTIKSYIDRGLLKAEKYGKFDRIRHTEIFDSSNRVKSLKYKR